MSKQKHQATLDVQLIEDEIDRQDMSMEFFFDAAAIGKSTWHRIKRSQTASIHVSCAIAYALGISPDSIIIRRFKTRK